MIVSCLIPWMTARFLHVSSVLGLRSERFQYIVTLNSDVFQLLKMKFQSSESMLLIRFYGWGKRGLFGFRFI